RGSAAGRHRRRLVMIDRDLDRIAALFGILVAPLNQESLAVRRQHDGSGSRETSIAPVDAGRVIAKRLGPAWIHEGGYGHRAGTPSLSRGNGEAAGAHDAWIGYRGCAAGRYRRGRVMVDRDLDRAVDFFRISVAPLNLESLAI